MAGSSASIAADEALARSLQQSEVSMTPLSTTPDVTARERQQAMNPLLRQQDVLVIEREQLGGKRVMLVVLAVFDTAALVALFLQLGSGGFPQSVEALTHSFDETAFDSFWFIPLSVAAVFPTVGAFGAILLWEYPLWTFCGYLVAMIGLRLFFLYEAGKREGLDNREELLLDMMLLTFAVFLQVYIFQAASTLGLLTRRLRMQVKFLQPSRVTTSTLRLTRPPVAVDARTNGGIRTHERA
uniref:Uncharacterized protein n=1 Tax=Coccolithus braarudii TaxID=221442 RepID=A0A7S0LUI5_9EUKA